MPGAMRSEQVASRLTPPKLHSCFADPAHAEFSQWLLPAPPVHHVKAAVESQIGTIVWTWCGSSR